jgi:hypothetical protein
MWRWLALAGALGALGGLWAGALGETGLAVAVAMIAAPAAGLALAARFGAVDAEATWPGRIAASLRLRWQARRPAGLSASPRPGFARIRLTGGDETRQAALATGLGGAGLGVDLDHETLLAYVIDDSPAMASHLHAVEAAGQPSAAPVS